jgi:FKBP-type peptidyl-prolyl cis-trans isomerase
MASTFAQDKIKLETDDHKYAYYRAYRFIPFLKEHRWPIHKDIMLQAAKDAFDGRPSKMANEDMKVIRRRVLENIRANWKKKPQTDAKTKPKTDKEKKLHADEVKLAYHLMYSHIITCQTQGGPYDKGIMLQAVKDALDGKIDRIKEEETNSVLRRLAVKRKVAQYDEAKKNWEAGVAYQKANKAKEGVITTASGLQYRVIKEGTGKKPTKQDTVSITYKTTLIDGTVLESKAKPKDFELTRVMVGWAEGLQLMKVGAKYEFVIPPDIGCGPYAPSGHKQPTASCFTLIIEVELINIVKKK